MNLTLETGVSAITVFIQGLISFFSPCVLPLIPLYIGYLSGGAKTENEDGTVTYKRSRVLGNTLFFVIGISFAFFLLGLGFTSAGKFFHNYQTLFTRIGGIIVILFGLYQLGLFGQNLFYKEHRIHFRPDTLAMNPLTALIMGFTFSFAWTPCVGPALASVLLLSASAASSLMGFLLIGVYTLGFVLPFMAVGLFTKTLLDWFKKYRSVVKYTVKAGGILMIFIGVMMFTGWMNGISSYLSGFGTTSQENSQTPSAAGRQDVSESTDSSVDSPGNASGNTSEKEAGNAPGEDTSENGSEDSAPKVPAPDFSLTDQYGNTHTLSDYKGKTVFLNFWATWCPPCKGEMPEIQEIYEYYGENGSEVVVLGIASPDYGREKDEETVAAFLEENGYSFPVVMDTGGLYAYTYGVSAYPTTFMIDKEGNVYGYVAGQLTREIMESIIEQTINSIP
ncbi:thiol-disulfide oxidoreductase ResA [Lachnospiraceae bacterium]|jgi:Cytochrome c biogenesis protein|nr:thiol-disulfide oxidoreductase ResA [Lachnospiraceae bacterium]